MSRPVVTIAMPVYNEEGRVADAIKDIIAQTYRPLEIIVCDDASTDRTLEIIEALAEHAEIKVLRNEVNIGVTGNFNRVRAAATGDYVMLRSGNDRMHPELTEELVKVLEDDPEVGLAYARTRLRTPEGEDAGVYPDEFYINSGDKKPLQRMLDVVMRFTTGEPNYGLIRRRFLRQVQAYGWFNGPDHVYIAEIAYHTKIKVVDRELSYRVDEPTDEAKYRLFASRRSYRAKRSGIEAQFDPMLNLNFIQMAYQHCEMVANTEMSLEEKTVASTYCVKILRARFETFMHKELDTLMAIARKYASLALRSEEISTFDRVVYEEVQRALMMASIVFPERAEITAMRHSLLDASVPKTDG
jgi:glycosyltransferase involved in cell wall biosynthesis